MGSQQLVYPVSQGKPRSEKRRSHRLRNCGGEFPALANAVALIKSVQLKPDERPLSRSQARDYEVEPRFIICNYKNRGGTT
jgi:hypothetical protein